ncbi:MAG TPA: molybdenum cofactor guanylyltransferase [Ktedonobacterales bacterium]|nr:molybdenum cofactor guanylyltransferase [Ktedonobacterales bacterium]
MIGDESYVNEVSADVIADVTGVVLAGGHSSRMGADKAALLIGDEPLLRRIVRRLRLALAETLVVGPPELAALLQPLAPGQATEHVTNQQPEQSARPIAETRVIPDAQPGLGPLGGLATALGAITTPYAFVIACDMPFVQPALIRTQAQLAHAGYTTTDPPTHEATNAPSGAISAPTGYDVVALRTAQGVEPLHAVYARACLPIAAAQLAAGDLAMWRLLARLHVRELTADEVARANPRGLSTLNANTPDEWARVVALADGPAGA